ncbi:predicted protein [Pyrenophora tritici-repentis Pt-1C-BFP]|uniref:Uncharacterized protein n=1 Tax=Pyrenophora tritici-repentis (strain Pt-1C-BFP) TaxID=426418 RepID=B2W375_PYRTR|nr:uncharacterized protein PTRG_03873 [Pyrenophora tritici-repentis Pt-1C-BFP]EDU46711.1 predicted protein [Pyrenophora tritici-repentis Pt-1C-BFP]
MESSSLLHSPEQTERRGNPKYIIGNGICRVSARLFVTAEGAQTRKSDKWRETDYT